MSRVFKADDFIPDETARRAANEILATYNHWKKGRETIGELYEQLGLKVGSPEMTAWLQVFFIESRGANVQDNISVLNAMDSSMLFCLWLGSRIERMGKI
jgi:hypothetical protein